MRRRKSNTACPRFIFTLYFGQVIISEGLRGGNLVNNRNIGIVVTVIAVLLFGCPGLVCLCSGAIAALVSLSGAPNSYFGVGSQPTIPLIGGLLFICLSVVLISIPFIVGFILIQRIPQPGDDEVVLIDAEAYEPGSTEVSETSEEPEELEDEIPPAI